MNTTIKPLHTASVKIKRITLWRREVDSRPEALAAVLEPFAVAGEDLRVFMRYRHPTDTAKAVIEVCPQFEESSKDAVAAAELEASSVSALVIEGRQVPGFGYHLAKAIAELEARVMFLVAQAIDGKYTVTIGFEDEADAEKVALSLLLTKIDISISEAELSGNGS
jgi:hypothetical protein